MTIATRLALFAAAVAAAFPSLWDLRAAAQEQATVGSQLTQARTTKGEYISWREHLIDDESTGGAELRGGDGLVMADLDKDGNLDIVSVHESDGEYDGMPDGLIRIAFGARDPNTWVNVTLANGVEAAAPEDVAVADLNGDGFLDIVGACELAHLIYFQNPGRNIRTAKWPRVIPPITDKRGSFIRVFLEDLNGDRKPEVIAANKGAQAPSVTQPATPVSWFEIAGNPLDGAAWKEHELARVVWPINAQPVDLDRDGDIDIIGGSVAERRIIWFENGADGKRGQFRERPLRVAGTSIVGNDRPAARRGDTDALVSGFNMDFVDLSGDGRLDIVTFEFIRLVGRSVVWLEQPARPDGTWTLHPIGDYAPDEVVGLLSADIDGDGRMDVMTGGYSAGSRNADAPVAVTVPAGRLAWFEPPRAAGRPWTRHDISRRQRGMFDKFVARDMDRDGDVDFVSTRGNSGRFDGVFWLEQVRSKTPHRAFEPARAAESPELPLPGR